MAMHFKTVIVTAVIATGGICIGGCSSDSGKYYSVRDVNSGRVFVTKDLDRHENGAVSLRDGGNGQTVTLQNSEVQKITKERFYTSRSTSGQNPQEVRVAEEQAAQAKAAADRAVEERAAANRVAQARVQEAKAAEERAAQEQVAAEKAAQAKAEEARVAEAKLAAAKTPAVDAEAAALVVAPVAVAGTQAATPAEFRRNLTSAKDEIDRTLRTLSELVDPGQTDLAATNKRFGEQVNSLKTHAARVKGEADAMKGARETYFAKWDERIAAIDNPTLRTAAEAKRTRLRKSQDKILVDSALVKESYKPFMADLDDTRKFLADDASKDSVSVLSPTVKKAQADGKLVKERIDAVIADLDEVEGKLVPAEDAATEK